MTVEKRIRKPANLSALFKTESDHADFQEWRVQNEPRFKGAEKVEPE